MTHSHPHWRNHLRVLADYDIDIDKRLLAIFVGDTNILDLMGVNSLNINFIYYKINMDNNK